MRLQTTLGLCIGDSRERLFKLYGRGYEVRAGASVDPKIQREYVYAADSDLGSMRVTVYKGRVVQIFFGSSS